MAMKYMNFRIAPSLVSRINADYNNNLQISYSRANSTILYLRFQQQRVSSKNPCELRLDLELHYKKEV